MYIFYIATEREKDMLECSHMSPSGPPCSHTCTHVIICSCVWCMSICLHAATHTHAHAHTNVRARLVRYMQQMTTNNFSVKTGKNCVDWRKIRLEFWRRGQGCWPSSPLRRKAPNGEPYTTHMHIAHMDEMPVHKLDVVRLYCIWWTYIPYIWRTL